MDRLSLPQAANGPFKLHRSAKDALVSHLAGLYTIQITLEAATNGQNTYAHSAQKLISSLEKSRQKLARDRSYKDILGSEEASREYLLAVAQTQCDDLVASVQIGAPLKPLDAVNTLLESAVMFEVARGLFPSKEVGEEATEQEEQDTKELQENKPEEAKEEPEEKYEIEKEMKEDTEIDETFMKRFAELSNSDTPTMEDKEDHIITNIIENDLGKVTDDDIHQKIQLCRKWAQRILANVKQGRDAFAGVMDGLDNDDITEDEIARTINSALEEPEDTETGDQFSLPELPSGIPGSAVDADQKEEEEESETHDEEEQDEIEDVATYTAQHHEHTTAAHQPEHNVNDLQSFMQTGQLLENAQKCARYAISAINYEDVDTALAELNKAIALLEKYQNS